MAEIVKLGGLCYLNNSKQSIDIDSIDEVGINSNTNNV